MTRVIGPPKSSRRKWTFLIALLVCVGFGVLFIPGALAVHDDGFQLDGDVSHACPPANVNAFCGNALIDWADAFTVTDTPAQNPTTETVTNNSANIGGSSQFTNATFTRDFQSGSSCTTNSTSTTFCTGDSTTFATGSKDTLDINGNACNFDHNVNSKIDIMNAYSVASIDPVTGHRVMYFGLEKNKDNGTNDVGFWFLQGNANCDASGGGHPNWTGKHTVNDVLVVSEFTNGGGVSNITAYRWVGGSNPLVQIASASGNGGDCKSASGGDALCATTNSGSIQFNTKIQTPWLTADATLGVGRNQIVPPDFFEGGIDLDRAFQGSGGTVPSCFNTFIADTRSSTSLTATLFDYARGQLGQCQSGLTTNAGQSSTPLQGEVNPPSSIGTGVVSSGTDTATLNITGTSTWGGTLTWYLCGPLSTQAAAAAACAETTDSSTPPNPVNHGVQVDSKLVSNADASHSYVSKSAFLTAAGSYCWHAHFQPNTASLNAGVSPADDSGASECFTVAPVQASLLTNASCDAATGQPCVLGVNTISDTATLSSTASQPGTTGPGGDTGLYKSIYLSDPSASVSAAGGTINWTLYGPTNGGCTDTKTLGTSSAAVSGNNTYPKSGQTAITYKPSLSDGVGTYTWVAVYTPDTGGNTTAPTAATCASPGSNETTVLTGSVSSSSAQRYLPNDRVTLTGTSGTTLSGTLTVTLYSGTPTIAANGTCTTTGATAVAGQSYTFNVSTATNTASFNTANTDPPTGSNTTFYVGTKPDGNAGGSAGNYFWLIHYHDNNLTSPNDRCEKSSVTIDDNPS